MRLVEYRRASRVDPAVVARAHASQVGVDVTLHVRDYLPTTISTASKADIDGRAGRIGALIARWFYDYIDRGVRAAPT